MPDKPIEILLVEDNPGDARLIRVLLSEARNSVFKCVWVESLGEALAKIGDEELEIVLLDLSLPDSQGFETFQRASDAAPDLPIVVLTGLDDEEMALKAMRRGAQDYLVKGGVGSNLLERVIRYSIERQRIQKEMQDLNANLEKRVDERTRELANAYDALSRANEELRELDRMKSNFIKVTSHELRTPLTAICGMLAILPERLSENQGSLRRCCQAAAHASKRLERLVVRVLKMAQKEEYGRSLEIESVDVVDLLDGAIEEVSPFVELRGHNLTTIIPEALPPVSLDPDKIQDVLVNLLMNAIKFTYDGGEITCAIARKNNDMLEFRVSDTGVGIHENERPHVFKEFFTSFDSMHHSSGEYEFGKRGLGLGLAIVKKFVEMHGGEVSLESAVGAGSTFSFVIPFEAPQNPPPENK